MRTTMHRYAMENIVPQLHGVVGSSLASVSYRTLKHEAEQDDIAESGFYLGAEVELGFENDLRLFVSWDQHVPYGHEIAFGLLLSTEPTFTEDRVTPYDASSIPIWRDHIGRAVNQLRLHGFDGAPFVLQLAFANSSVYVGSAYQTRFGDGDDVFIATDISTQTHLSCLWDSHEIRG